MDHEPPVPHVRATPPFAFPHAHQIHQTQATEFVTFEGSVELFPFPLDARHNAQAVPAPPDAKTVTAGAAVPAAPTVPGVFAELFTAFHPVHPLLDIVPDPPRVPVEYIL